MIGGINLNKKNYRDSAWYLSILLKLVSVTLVISLIKIIYDYLVNKSLDNLGGGGNPSTAIIEFEQITKNVISNSNLTSARLLMSVLTTILLIAVFLLASSYFKSISNNCSPFDKKELKKLNIIATGVLIFSVVKPILYSIMVSILSHSIFVHYELGILFIVGIILIVMVGVFNYGAMLQTSYDDTV